MKRFWLRVVAVPGILLALILTFCPVGEWWDLQRRGQVPKGAKIPYGREWAIARWTTWWGKPLDPEKFWKGRVIWNDSSAEDEARRRGRLYPPIPMHVPRLVKDAPLGIYWEGQKDWVLSGGGPDSGPTLPLHVTNHENGYWNWFWRKQPKSPETLEFEQVEVATRILRVRSVLGEGGQTHEKGRALEIGMPQEALADEALLWAYVMKKRLEYAREKERAAGLKSANASIANHFIETFLADIAVDKKLITEPLTPQQTKAANAWKVTYLQRLCREKIDRSYIDAYLKAWGLRPEHVLQGGN